LRQLQIRNQKVITMIHASRVYDVIINHTTDQYAGIFALC